MAAIIRNIFEETESPLLSKLKEKDRERCKKMIAAFYENLQKTTSKKLKKVR